MAFEVKSNYDDVWIRDIIIGLLAMLNDRVTIKSGEKLYTIPFYLSFGNDERWMQDFFTDYKNCEGISQHTDGNTDPVPRGVLTLDGITIDAGAITSNHIRGNFVKENADGMMEYYSAEILAMPFIMSMNMEILTSDLLESFKIFQEIIQVFYKTATFNTTHRGFLLQSVAGFPEDYTLDSQFEFGWDEKEAPKLELALEIECYMPIVFKDTIRSVNTGTIDQFKINIYEFNKSVENLLRTFNIPKEK